MCVYSGNVFVELRHEHEINYDDVAYGNAEDDAFEEVVIEVR